MISLCREKLTETREEQFVFARTCDWLWLFITRRIAEERTVYCAWSSYLRGIPGKNVFIVEVVNLVMTKVIKHRVNGCKGSLRTPWSVPSSLFDKRHYGRGKQHGVDGPFVNRSLTLKAASVVRDAHTQDFSHTSLRVQKLAETRSQRFSIR